MYKIEKFRSEKNKEYYFRIVAENGNIICSSEGYKNKIDRDKIVKYFSFNMIVQFAKDHKNVYVFANIGEDSFATFSEETFEEKMNGLNWFKFSMYKIYTMPNGKNETFLLNDRTGKTGFFNTIEKDSLVKYYETHEPKITRIEEITHNDFLNETKEK